MTWWEKLFSGFNTVEEKPDPLIVKLQSKGYAFNEDKEWWQRIWTTETPEGTEKVIEVYRKKEGEWTSIMYGNNGDIFYEEPVRYEYKKEDG